MRAARFKVIGGRVGQEPLRGKDVRVVVETPDGEELLVPAQSLVMRIGGREELVLVTVEVPAVLVDLHGVQLATVADVAPGGPESQWERSLGKAPGEAVADVEAYTATPHVVAGERPVAAKLAPLVVDAARFLGGDQPADPLAELDAVIAGGGLVETIRPRGPESAYEAAATTTRPGEPFTGVVKGHP